MSHRCDGSGALPGPASGPAGLCLPSTSVLWGVPGAVVVWGQ